MRELHVAKHGCDQNSGTADEPFLTIGRAASVAVENDVVIVHEGVYREWVNPKNGGRDHYHRIVYAAAENEKVVIKGSEVIGNWKKTSDHVWEAEVDNRLFGDYNPFREILAGDWMIEPTNPYLHLGGVYINGAALREKLHLDLVETAEMSWFAQVKEDKTVILANFGELDPTDCLTEINVRQGCFYPDRNGVNYITVRGFEMAHAACPWSPPTAVQPGMIWTHWSKGWRFYDEQVTGFRQSWNQRLRWAKGGLQSFGIYWKRLLKGVFSKKFLACYDMLMSIAPGYVISILATLFNIFASIYSLAIGTPVLTVLMSVAKFVLPSYAAVWLLGFVCTLSEWKHLRTTNFKKILYSFTFPLFLFTFIPIAFVALFSKVEWKHIAHKEMSEEDKKRLGLGE